MSAKMREYKTRWFQFWERTM